MKIITNIYRKYTLSKFSYMKYLIYKCIFFMLGFSKILEVDTGVVGVYTFNISGVLFNSTVDRYKVKTNLTFRHKYFTSFTFNFKFKSKIKLRVSNNILNSISADKSLKKIKFLSALHISNDSYSLDVLSKLLQSDVRDILYFNPYLFKIPFKFLYTNVDTNTKCLLLDIDYIDVDYKEGEHNELNPSKVSDIMNMIDNTNILNPKPETDMYINNVISNIVPYKTNSKIELFKERMLTLNTNNILRGIYDDI